MNKGSSIRNFKHNSLRLGIVVLAFFLCIVLVYWYMLKYSFRKQYYDLINIKNSIEMNRNRIKSHINMHNIENKKLKSICHVLINLNPYNNIEKYESNDNARNDMICDCAALNIIISKTFSNNNDSFFIVSFDDNNVKQNMSIFSYCKKGHHNCDIYSGVLQRLQKTGDAIFEDRICCVHLPKSQDKNLGNNQIEKSIIYAVRIITEFISKTSVEKPRYMNIIPASTIMLANYDILANNILRNHHHGQDRIIVQNIENIKSFSLSCEENYANILSNFISREYDNNVSVNEDENGSKQSNSNNSSTIEIPTTIRNRLLQGTYGHLSQDVIRMFSTDYKTPSYKLSLSNSGGRYSKNSIFNQTCNIGFNIIERVMLPRRSQNNPKSLIDVDNNINTETMDNDIDHLLSSTVYINKMISSLVIHSCLDKLFTVNTSTSTNTFSFYQASDHYSKNRLSSPLGRTNNSNNNENNSSLVNSMLSNIDNLTSMVRIMLSNKGATDFCNAQPLFPILLLQSTDKAKYVKYMAFSRTNPSNEGKNARMSLNKEEQFECKKFIHTPWINMQSSMIYGEYDTLSKMFTKMDDVFNSIYETGIINLSLFISSMNIRMVIPSESMCIGFDDHFSNSCLSFTMHNSKTVEKIFPSFDHERVHNVFNELGTISNVIDIITTSNDMAEEVDINGYTTWNNIVFSKSNFSSIDCFVSHLKKSYGIDVGKASKIETICSINGNESSDFFTLSIQIRSVTDMTLAGIVLWEDIMLMKKECGESNDNFNYRLSSSVSQSNHEIYKRYKSYNKFLSIPFSTSSYS